MATQGNNQQSVLSGQIQPKLEINHRVINHRAIIDALRGRLIRFGVPPGCFNRDESYLLGYTDSQVVQLFVPIANVIDDSKLKTILKLHSPNNTSTVKQFFEYLEWLRSPLGQKELKWIDYFDRLHRRGKGVLTAHEMGLIYLFECQKEEYIESVVNLVMQLRSSSSAIGAKLAAVSDQFEPSSSYKGLNKDELKRACWEAYRIECQAIGVVPVEMNETSLTMAVHCHGEFFRQKDYLAYLQDSRRIKKLTNYFDEKIYQAAEKAESLWTLLMALVEDQDDYSDEGACEEIVMLY